MKKTILYLAMALMSLPMMAQEAEQSAPANDKPVHYINLAPKVGYAVGFDNFKKIDNFANTKYLGGGVAGLALQYELQYKHLLFNVGVDFDWLHSISKYNYQMAERPMLAPYSDMTYIYRAHDMRESRQVGMIGLPINIGAQFGNFYFLVGAKVGYGLLGHYSLWGDYDVVAYDPILGAEIGTNAQAKTGSYTINRGDEGFSGPLALKPLEVRALAEVGLDLDQWLQKPVPAKKKKQRKGATHEQFTVHNMHYRLGLFAEYDVLNVNNQADGDATMAFANNTPTPTGATSLMQKAGATLNNLLVGVKFAIQFELPAKKAKPQPIQPSNIIVKVVDAETGEPLQPADSLRYSVYSKDKQRYTTPNRLAGNKPIAQRFTGGDYKLGFAAIGYHYDSLLYTPIPGAQDTFVVKMQKTPRMRVTVVDDETGEQLRTRVKIYHKTLKKAAVIYSETQGVKDTLLRQDDGYRISISRKGYEPYKAKLQGNADNLVIRLIPVKVGKTFILEDLYFPTGKTDILPESEPMLQTLTDFMNDDENRRIMIVGHTDNVGKDAANMRLSDGRAKAVRQALIERGIAEDRIEAEGKGETQPIATNDTPEGRQKNRRVEVVILQ